MVGAFRVGAAALFIITAALGVRVWQLHTYIAAYRAAPVCRAGADLSESDCRALIPATIKNVRGGGRESSGYEVELEAASDERCLDFFLTPGYFAVAALLALFVSVALARVKPWEGDWLPPSEPADGI